MGQYLDPMLMELKESVLVNINECFALGCDDILSYKNRICVLDVDDLRTRIFAEDHVSRYSIHLGSTKMYHELKQIYWWDDIKMDIEEYVAKSHNCQHVKEEHLKPLGLTHIIEVPTWKWEAINLDFVVSFPKNKRKHDSIWVIVDRLTKSAHFIPLKSTYRARSYARLYIDEM